uniref:Uncharacterized protein n=1 Tax=Micrurus lemniscatus lemniscatus TaxID=129467 RepID=A0A2D4ILB0_MICLE
MVCDINIEYIHTMDMLFTYFQFFSKHIHTQRFQHSSSNILKSALTSSHHLRNNCFTTQIDVHLNQTEAILLILQNTRLIWIKYSVKYFKDSYLKEFRISFFLMLAAKLPYLQKQLL